MEKKIIIATSGTGGHTIPAITLHKLLTSHKIKTHIIVNKNSLGEKLLRQENILFSTIRQIGFPRKNPLRMLNFLALLIVSCIKSYNILKNYKPNLIIGMGGFVSFPVVFIAWLLGIPVIIHEQNVKLGLANLFSSILAKKICVSFKTTKLPNPLQYKVIYTGNPVREDFFPRDRMESIKKLQLDPERFTILIFGGSQGAHMLNIKTIKAISSINNSQIQIIHITGKNDKNYIQDYYKQHNIKSRVYDFYNDMGELYSCADLVICRSGASTISELMYTKKPAILIPYPYATERHQYYNAKLLESYGAASVIDEKKIDTLETLLSKLLNEKNIVYQMKKSYDNIELPDFKTLFLKVISNVMK